jgi:hypothetical protein
MKSYVVTFCLAVLALSSANAGSVSVSTFGGRLLAASDGSVLPEGCLVRVGTFNLPSATRDATLASTKDYHLLKSWFRPLGESIPGAGSVQQAGSASSAMVTNGFPADGETFGTLAGISSGYLAPGTQLYLWVFDAAAPESASQWGIFTSGTWRAPQALGSLTLATSGAVSPLQGAATSNLLKLVRVPDTFANWSWKAFPGSAAPQNTPAGGDSDGDRLPNLAEYAWNLNPSGRSDPRTRLAVPQSGGQGHSFTFDVPRQRPDVQVVAEVSTNMKTWTTAASEVVATTDEYETRRCSAPSGAACFWRVQFRQVTAP